MKLPKKTKLYESERWLKLKRYTQHKSIEQMAEEAGCTTMTIRRYMEKFGIR